MDTATLDRDARLRQAVRAVLAELHHLGVPTSLLKGKCLAELWELRDATLRQLMRAPGRAA